MAAQAIRVQPVAQPPDRERTDQDLLRVDKLAEQLDVTPSTIKRWLQESGVQLVVFSDKVVCVEAQDWHSFVESRKQPATVTE